MGEESLLDGVEDGATDGAEPSWHLAEGVAGEGEAPEWFKADKYGSVADQAKAYTDLEGKFGAFTGAPEEYELKAPELELPEGVEFEFNAEDPLFQAFVPVAKEMGINQDGFDRLVKLYVEQQAQDVAALTADAAAEKEKLGPKADERLADLMRRASGLLDETQLDAFKGLATTAESVGVLEQLLKNAQPSKIPDPNNIDTTRMESMQEELRALEGEKDENGELKWITNAEHRAKIEGLRARIYGNAEYRQVIGQ